MQIIGKIWSILLPKHKKKAFVLLCLILIAGLFESVGLGMILPLIGLMTAPDAIFAYPAVQPLLTMLGNPTPERMFFIVLVSFVVLYFIVSVKG